MMKLLVAVAMPALELGAKLGVGVDWEARARLRLRCRAALWRRLLHVRNSHSDKRRLVPLAASELERRPWTHADWGEKPLSRVHARELTNFFDACFPTPITNTFPVVNRAVLSAELGRKKASRGKQRSQSALAAQRAETLRLGLPSHGLGRGATPRHESSSISQILPRHRSTTFIDDAHDGMVALGEEEAALPDSANGALRAAERTGAAAFTLRGTHPERARVAAPPRVQGSLIRAAHFEFALRRWCGLGTKGLSLSDVDELWCRAAEIEAEIIAFEAAQLLACLLPHSRVLTKLPTQLSQNPTHILALARLTGKVRSQPGSCVCALRRRLCACADARSLRLRRGARALTRIALLFLPPSHSPSLSVSFSPTGYGVLHASRLGCGKCNVRRH